MNFDSFNSASDFITKDQDFINSYIDLDQFNTPFNKDSNNGVNNISDEFAQLSDFNNELYQIISNDTMISTSISSPASTTTAHNNNMGTSYSMNYQINLQKQVKQQQQQQEDEYPSLEASAFDVETFLKDCYPLSHQQLENQLDSFSINSSPLESISSPLLIDQKIQEFSQPATPETFTSVSTTSTSSPASYNNTNNNNAPHYNSNLHNNVAQRNLSISSNSSSNSNSSLSVKKNLDSRLSLQKLGTILQTSSLDETIKIEKFILKIFEDDLGFPLGYKTWIRDTNEEYRKHLLDQLYNRVNPHYPKMTKTLLETVVKRATYSMMQGRLRKERRAAMKKKRS